MTPMSQEEIMTCTKTVMQGLDTLRVEHQQVLNSVLASVKTTTTNHENASTNLSDEKISMIKKGIEMIELALGEAQVFINQSIKFSFIEKKENPSGVKCKWDLQKGQGIEKPMSKYKSKEKLTVKCPMLINWSQL